MTAPRPLRVELYRRFTDLDLLGHVNNVAYFDYLQEARIALLREVGFVRAESFAQVVVKQELTHLKPLLLSPRPIVIETWVTGLRNSSYTVKFRILDENDEIAAEATTVVAVIDKETSKPTRISDELRALLAPYTLVT